MYPCIMLLITTQLNAIKFLQLKLSLRTKIKLSPFHIQYNIIHLFKTIKSSSTKIIQNKSTYIFFEYRNMVRKFSEYTSSVSINNPISITQLHRILQKNIKNHNRTNKQMKKKMIIRTFIIDF